MDLGDKYFQLVSKISDAVISIAKEAGTKLCLI